MRISDWSSDVCSSDLWKHDPTLATAPIAILSSARNCRLGHDDHDLCCGRNDMKKATKGPSIKTAQALLAKHECPVPFHEVRTRFLGNIATPAIRSEEHTSELQSLMRISYAVYCLNKQKNIMQITNTENQTTRHITIH